MKTKTYQAKKHARLSDKDAERIAGFLENKFGDVGCTPVDMIRVATPKRSPIHNDFEWDNAVAGHEHRLWQARHLLNSIEVVFVNGEEKPPTRAFHRVVVSGEDEPREYAYVPARIVWENADYSAQVIERAYAELLAWKARYEQYESLAQVAVQVGELAESIAV